ncbi:MAG: hypothetical protein COW01_02255 [Bdellovibrionales bacterium CG12_big_fil_rev_8_21_14_0_65_38_15]|nr:MAG: hypothetical protein COW79_02490 [Bdellovibrionales bacterium CG22_combo_CG10-13_8_21_14_all_38_13]PIQ57129.1 MAG: hypothetical protein COW01_02255 [Bdellovibrionales bacterium CG12_big_fil_rev_8_21_14_0_65_38_15]PIR30159.1 MAG: hypothetical protein COV38_07650 [Bdellovibrionales bacterium CG11_big_fil_rev_8_21_14_0_20_38_13]
MKIGINELGWKNYLRKGVLELEYISNACRSKMLLIFIIPLLSLLSCNSENSLSEIWANNFEYCTNNFDNENCSIWKNKLAIYRPTLKEEKELIKECEKLDRLSCSLLAYFYREMNELENSKKYSMVACQMGDINACITGWGISTTDKEQFLFSEIACNFGDLKSCSDKVVKLVNFGKVDEAKQLATELCLNGGNIDCYNLACLESKAGDLKSAQQYLLKSFELGFDKYSYVVSDSDLVNLKNSKYWQEIKLIINKESSK